MNRPFHDERASLYARIDLLERAVHAHTCEACTARRDRRTRRSLRIGVVVFALFAWAFAFFVFSACSGTSELPRALYANH